MGMPGAGSGTVGRDGEGTTYGLHPVYKVIAMVTVPVFPLVGCFLFAQAVREGAAFGIVASAAWTAGAAYQAWYTLCRMPVSIVVTDATIRFVIVAGALEVPWADLESVGPPAWNTRRSTWIWRWRGGKARSWAFRNGFRLLEEVRRHAPHVRVDL